MLELYWGKAKPGSNSTIHKTFPLPISLTHSLGFRFDCSLMTSLTSLSVISSANGLVINEQRAFTGTNDNEGIIWRLCNDWLSHKCFFIFGSLTKHHRKVFSIWNVLIGVINENSHKNIWWPSLNLVIFLYFIANADPNWPRPCFHTEKVLQTRWALTFESWHLTSS